MPKKQLIVANDVRQAAKSGEHVLVLDDKSTIVTSEARSVAKDLGVELRVAMLQKNETAPPQPNLADEADVRRAVAAHVGGEDRDAVVGEVMRRIALERGQAPDSGIRKIAAISDSPLATDGTANLSQLDLTALLGGAAAPRSAGFLAWSKGFFAFTRDSDEINIVLEGELQFRVGQALVTARAGDVMLVPKGTRAEIGTPSSVRLFYVGYSG